MPAQDPSIPDLLRKVMNDAQDLIRTEIALAKAEVRQDVARIKVGVVAFAGAAIAGIVGALPLLMAIAWAIAQVLRWPVWAGFLIVAVVTLAAAGALAAMGRRRLASVQPLPFTVDTMKENAKWIRARTS